MFIIDDVHRRSSDLGFLRSRRDRVWNAAAVCIRACEEVSKSIIVPEIAALRGTGIGLREASRRAAATTAAGYNGPPVGTKGVSLPRAGGEDRPGACAVCARRCDHTSSLVICFITRRLMFCSLYDYYIARQTIHKIDYNIRHILRINIVLCLTLLRQTTLASKVLLL